MEISPEDLSRVCKRFRVLIIGRRNAGKTTILEKMTGSDEGAKPRIRDKEGRLVVSASLIYLNQYMIDYEITYPSSPRFVFHDSRGIEAGAESDCHEYIQKFIDDRAQQPRTRDQLHAIW
ncbi:hypothetical protein F5888DRAFT_1623325 [Russula emetica]|nr:hypothetical protein F5888DRAFT_1623325 [Russula emetica]